MDLDTLESLNDANQRLIDGKVHWHVGIERGRQICEKAENIEKILRALDYAIQVNSKYDQEEYRPDYYGCVDGLLSPAVVEVKIPGVDKCLLRKDERKLFSVMKLSLDWMIEHRVESPMVIGALVQGNVMQVFEVDIRYDQY
ncbi:hypothetical protein BGX34_002295 [Mortierella sp. NVP85]|nr:hypothetical protein BGX34_002295 [Mortierella sp. NVP85]